MNICIAAMAANKNAIKQNLVSSKKATYGGISNILFYGIEVS